MKMYNSTRLRKIRPAITLNNNVILLTYYKLRIFMYYRHLMHRNKLKYLIKLISAPIL